MAEITYGGNDGNGGNPTDAVHENGVNGTNRRNRRKHDLAIIAAMRESPHKEWKNNIWNDYWYEDKRKTFY